MFSLVVTSVTVLREEAIVEAAATASSALSVADGRAALNAISTKPRIRC